MLFSGSFCAVCVIQNGTTQNKLRIFYNLIFINLLYFSLILIYGNGRIIPSEIKNAVKKLCPLEKLELNEVIWANDTAIPAEYQFLVIERIKKAQENPEILADWEVAVKTLHS